MQEALLHELLREAEVTRRVLERTPEARLPWQPHPTSLTLGQLAMHVATTPGDFAHLAALDEFDVSAATFTPPQPGSVAEVLGAFQRSLATAGDFPRNLSDARAAAPWRLLLRGKELWNVPRAGLLRSLMLNHWYHHRGQLTVYLRLLEAPVPVIYGRSRDENPFA